MLLPRVRLTERQVLMMLLGITALTVFGAFLGSTLFTIRAKKPLTTNARLRWVNDPSPAQQADGRYLVSEYFDPSVMSLPHPRGFSRMAWSYLAPPQAEIFEPARNPEFLPPPSGLTMPDLLKNPSLNELVMGELLAPQPEDDDVEGLTANDGGVPATNSVIQVEGELRHRPIVLQPVLPLAPADVPVRATRVQIAVTPDGQVRYAVLDRSSGNEALDTQAVALAQQVHFGMAATADPLALTWGTVRFLWALAPAP